MKRLIKISALALMVVLAMTGCKKSYTITVKTNNADWGTVTGGGSYKSGETATITAIPAAGYYFNCWNDGNVENPRKVVVNGNAEYIATFSDTPGGGGTDNAVTVSGSISANTTWPDRGAGVDYIVDGRFYVEGNALLTIEPGVTIMFASTVSGITVEENAGLRMVGTADKPIILTGPANNPNIGAWDDVVIQSNRSDNQFEYVNFINGGSYGEVVEINGKLSMKHCMINGATNYGVFVGGSLSAFENNTIKNTKCPVLLTNYMAVNNLGAGNTYTNNTNNMIELDTYWLDENNVTVTYGDQGVPYYLKSGLHVDGNAIAKVNAGVVFVMAYDQSVSVTSNALLQVNGTASQPVVFRALNNEPGYWNGIEIASTRQTNGGCNLTYCNIQNAGKYAEDAALYTYEDTRLALNNVTISGSYGYGMSIAIPIDWDTDQYAFSNYHVTASGLSFSNCDEGNIYERNKDQVFTSWPGNKKLAKR
jgi:hypothetical protein